MSKQPYFKPPTRGFFCLSKLLTIFVKNIDKNSEKAARKELANYQNIEKHKFKKGQSGNPKGRPPKVLSSVLSELKKEGYEEVKAAQVREAYEILLGLDETRLIEVATNRDFPAVMTIAAKHLLSKKGAGFEIMEKMLDRAHGKATQRVEQKHEVKGSLPDWLTGKLEGDDSSKS